MCECVNNCTLIAVWRSYSYYRFLINLSEPTVSGMLIYRAKIISVANHFQMTCNRKVVVVML